jgi:oxygen-dependent protoporphyrinogen oxidase
MADSPMRIGILGGGVTGLATAWFLRQQGVRPAEIVLFEGSDRFGGNVRSERQGELMLDVGPDAWVTTKPAASRLAAALGLTKELIVTPEHRRNVFIAQRTGLVPLPPGFVLGIPTSLRSVASTPLFTLRGKARMAADLAIPRRSFEGDEDESIAEFVTRRLGREACDRLVAPLLGGIFSGDAEELSIRAGVPQLVAMEKEYGSLIRGVRAQRRERQAAGATHAFVSMPGGVGRLVERLVEELDGVDLRLSTPVRRLTPLESGYALDLGDGKRETVSAVVLAAPSYALAPMVEGMNARLASLLAQLQYGSTALVFLAYPKRAVGHALDATGFLVPRSTGSELVAVTILSSKWEGRAPDSTALFRLFFGGARDPGVVDRSDEDLTRLGIAELGKFLPLQGDPSASFVRRFPKASPQPKKGHLRWLRDVQTELARHPRIVLAGNGYGGVGIPDCVRQANEAATALLG